MQSFGKWLLARRREQKLTQGQVAQKAGISTSYVSTLEREERHHLTNAPPQPTAEVVEKIAQALGVPVDEAREAAGYTPRSASPPIEIGVGATVKLADKDLSTEEQEEIAEELALAYELIMARRKAKKAKTE